MKITAVLTVRNEGAFLLEWLAHHRAAGVTDFLVFSNDCQDGTGAILDRLSELGWLTHERNDGPYDKRGIQFTALKAAEKHPLAKGADWLLPLDVDEFVNVHTGAHTIPDLIAALPEATAIPLTWRLFGNAGIARYEDRPITETFTGAAPAIMHWPWRASMFKTLYRNDGTYSKLGVHRPRQADKQKLESARWFDGSGRELDQEFKTRRIFSNYGQDNYALAQLNHYPLGAMESFILKAYRGRAVHDDHALGMDYWVERNFSETQDTSISALCPKRQTIQSELLDDQQLATLHEKAVLWRKTTFDQLMLEEPYRALFARLLMTPESRAIPLKHANFLKKFGIRALTQG